MFWRWEMFRFVDATSQSGEETFLFKEGLLKG